MSCVYCEPKSRTRTVSGACTFEFYAASETSALLGGAPVCGPALAGRPAEAGPHTKQPSANYSMTGPYGVSCSAMTFLSPATTIEIFDGSMYVCAMRCTSAGVVA